MLGYGRCRRFGRGRERRRAGVGACPYSYLSSISIFTVSFEWSNAMHYISRIIYPSVVALFCLGNRHALADNVRPACPPLVNDNYFFLASSTPSAPLAASLDQFQRQWYSKHLRAMSEPSLSCGSNSELETYRFLWLRTFHHPVAVRIARSETGVQLTAVELSGAGGYEPGSTLKQIHKSLSSDQWQKLTDGIETSEYWSQPSVEKDNFGLDGAQWIIEARRGQTYHIVDRWSGGGIHFLGLLFLELAELKPAKPDEIY